MVRWTASIWTRIVIDLQMNDSFETIGLNSWNYLVTKSIGDQWIIQNLWSELKNNAGCELSSFISFFKQFNA